MQIKALPIRIGGRPIGPGHPVYIVAEMSANHNRDFRQAAKILRAAKIAGADAVKLQTYTPDTMTIQSNSKYFRIEKGTPWQGRTLYDLYEDAYMPWEWQPKLKKRADALGISLFSTPFDASATTFLKKMGVPAFKVASFEIVDIPLIQEMARTGKPLIISTGMASVVEIAEAVDAAHNAGCEQIALLKCNSAYPAPIEEMNLLTIPHMSEAFGVPVGLSDHTLGIAVPVAAVSLGACIVEKHLTLSRSAKGPDISFSLEPDEFKTMVDAIRAAERALGKVAYGASRGEAPSMALRRSLFVTSNMEAGEEFTRGNVRSIRPADGLPPKFLDSVLGRRASKNIKKGTPLNWSMVG